MTDNRGGALPNRETAAGQRCGEGKGSALIHRPGHGNRLELPYGHGAGPGAGI